MPRKQSVLYVVLAAVALSVGALVYLLDRQPEHTYFLSHGLTIAGAPHAWFGAAGNYLPAFLHVYAFMLLTLAVAGRANARVIRVGVAWFVIASLFELGQHPAISTLIAALLPAWFAYVPVLDNIADYFLKGTFDPLDFLAIAAGTVAACLTVVLAGHRMNPRPSGRPRYGALRYLTLGGTSLAGMLAIIGSGGDTGVTALGSGDDSLIYVSGNASDALLVYAAANTVAGNTPASRTVEDLSNTTLEEPRSIAVDMARNRIYVANAIDNTILVFNSARTMTGDIAPARTISGGSLSEPTGLFLDVVNDRLYVTNKVGNSILIYDSASTAATPTRSLTGVATTLSMPTGIFVDATRNLLYVANGNNRILVFNSAAITALNINITPLRTISISSSIAGVFVDVMADRLYVANTGANSIFIFDDASTAQGSALHRVISASLNEPRDVFVDTGTDRLYVANAVDDSILVFNNAGTTNNPLAPARTLNLPTFTDPWGIYVDVTPIVIGSTAGLDGYVSTGFGGGVNTDPVDNEPKTGDVEDVFGAWRAVARQFYSFGWTGIPSTVNVRSATLRLYQANVQGSPYAHLGSVVVDHVDYGAALDSADYDAAALISNIGTLSTNDTQEYKRLSVTSSVAGDLAGRTRSQFRLRFAAENNVNFNDDYVQFTDAEDSCCTANKPPQLVITILP